MTALDQHGTALVAALAIVMILLPVGAFVVLQCRTDLLIQHNLRAEIETFYVAEAGLEHAIAEIAPGTSFDDILTGPDHLAGTPDDGIFSFAEGAPSAFPFAPFRYDVRVTRSGSDMVSVVSSGTGINGATRVVSVLVKRSAVPVTPAAFYAEGDVSALDMGSADFLLSGFDHQLADPPDAPAGPAAALPALSSSSVDMEGVLRQRLRGDSAQRLVGAGGTPSISTAPALDLPRYALACANRPEHIQVPGLTVDEAMALGTLQAPQLSIVSGDLNVAGQLSGAGVMVVQGTLEVTGTVAFTGLVLAMGGIVFDAGSDVTILGGLWRAASMDSRVQLGGRGAVVFSSAALATVDTAFQGLLPHPAVVASWQEQL
jgi:hypothetical protein